MNFPELKQDFYKRFEQSSKFLHFTSQGLLCTLLGHVSVPQSPSLTCTLSMRVQMFARAAGGQGIKIESSDSDKFFAYTPGDPTQIFRGKGRLAAELIDTLRGHSLKGTEILYQTSIPDFLPHMEVFSTALVKSLFKVNDIELDTFDTAAICAMGENISPYLAMLSAKSGYCTLIASGEPKSLPFPMSGYKILSVYCTEKTRQKERLQSISRAMSQITRLYPHVGGICDVTREMVEAVRIKDKKAVKYMYHLINENERIQEAEKALKRCDVKTLFRQMTISQKSIERFWDIGDEHICLSDCMRGLDGVMTARCSDKGVIAIVEEDMVNYVINMVKDTFETNIGYQPTFCVSDAE